MYDVIVVGGGPVGSRVACRLAEMGYGVAVLERKERVGEQVCCIGIVGRECVSSFNIEDSVIQRLLNSAKLFSPSGILLRPYREATQACVIDRSAFDLAMAARAEAKGVSYLLNSPVWNIEVAADRVRAEIANGGEGSSVEARAVVVTTGFSSGLVERLGLGRVGDFVTGAQAEVEVSDASEVEVYCGQDIAPGFFAWLVPTVGQRALVGLLARQNPGRYLAGFIASLAARGRITSADASFSYGGIPLKPLTRSYGDRLLVVGDAAGQVKPTSGGGIYYGLLCADIAADNLGRALASNSLSARSLARYQREWKRKIGRELRIGYWARRLYERLSDGQIDRVFDIIKSNGIDRVLLETEGLSFDWHGDVVLSLLKDQALARVVEAMKIPLRVGGQR